MWNSPFGPDFLQSSAGRAQMIDPHSMPAAPGLYGPLVVIQSQACWAGPPEMP